MPECDVCDFLPRLDSAFVFIDGTYWNANLRDSDQTLLGTTFITLKRHAPELDYLKPEEEDEFIMIRNRLIYAIREAFSPLTFNLSCLKNDAFKNDPDGTPSERAHVHYHLKPRYGTQTLEFHGERFTDPAPGRYLATFERKKPTRETALQIAATIRQHL